VKKINCPDFGVRDTFDSCIQSYKVKSKKREYKSCRPELIAAEDLYIRRKKSESLSFISKSQRVVGTIGKSQMEILYNRLKNKRNSDCRQLYDSLFNLAPHNICPLCGNNQATTIDHYLPKSKFAKYIITPINLVPCCHRCNNIKDHRSAGTAAKELLHPYFDDISSYKWLNAEIIKTSPPSAKYDIVDKEETD